MKHRSYCSTLNKVHYQSRLIFIYDASSFWLKKDFERAYHTFYAEGNGLYLRDRKFDIRDIIQHKVMND